MLHHNNTTIIKPSLAPKRRHPHKHLRHLEWRELLIIPNHLYLRRPMFVREHLHGIEGGFSTGVDTLRGGEERFHEQEERVFYAEGPFAGCEDED